MVRIDYFLSKMSKSSLIPISMSHGRSVSSQCTAIAIIVHQITQNKRQCVDLKEELLLS